MATGRERVLTALQHREADRVPRDLGGTESSGLTGKAAVCLCKHLGIERTPRIFEPFQYVAETPPELADYFRVDTWNLTAWPSDWKTVTEETGESYLVPAKWTQEKAAEKTVVRAPDGTVIAERPDGGFYFDPAHFPLSKIEDSRDLEPFRQAVMKYDWPFFADETLESFQLRAKQAHDSGACVVLNLCCHFLAAGMWLRGLENFMIDLLSNDKLVRALFDILLEGYLERVSLLAPKVKGAADVTLFNDDLGSQNGPLISPELYRKYLKPCQRRLFHAAKKAFGTPVLFHSCGAVSDFIPDLIECGVDALNPVQFTASKMELSKLKKDFGRDITFWGGGADTQNTLNRASPKEVREHVRRNADIMAPGGGFVFCQAHNIQPDVPAENITAMYDALDGR